MQSETRAVSAPGPAEPAYRIPWTIVAAGAAMAFVFTGSTQSFGVFLKVVTEDLGVGRETFALAIAVLQLATGIPVAAYLADRYGHWKVIVPASVVFAVAMLLTAQAQTGVQFLAYLGFLGGIAISGASMTVVVGAVGQMVPVRRRSFALGIVTAGSSAGMFVLVPAWQQILNLVGWRTNFALFALVPLFIGLMAFIFLRDADKMPKSADVVDEPFVEMLKRARKNRDYLLLTAGFFVCGFHVSFIAAHLPAYLSDEGISATGAALALAMIGLFNIFGSAISGRLGDRYRRSRLLAIIYSLRGVVIFGLLVLPLTEFTAIAFGALMGLLWLATVPLTSATVAHLLGARYLAVMFGTTFFSHQIGSFLGVWLGGRVYDAIGTYDPIWIAGIALGFASALIHLPIGDRRGMMAAAAAY
jgi:predicted MFS family arabinose efflux permease